MPTGAFFQICSQEQHNPYLYMDIQYNYSPQQVAATFAELSLLDEDELNILIRSKFNGFAVLSYYAHRRYNRILGGSGSPKSASKRVYVARAILATGLQNGASNAALWQLLKQNYADVKAWLISTHVLGKV
jgi:hypothetical protein